MCQQWGGSVAWFKPAEKASHTESCKEFETLLSLYHHHHICIGRSVPLHWKDSLALAEREMEDRRRTKLKMESRDKQNVFMSLSSLTFI